MPLRQPARRPQPQSRLRLSVKGFSLRLWKLLEVPLEDEQYLAGHANPRTTQIDDRQQRRVTRNIVERLSV